MKEFETSLLREKFLIHNPGSDTGSVKPVIALSNRIEVNLESGDGKTDETIIVRAQNMHLCTRMAAKILKTYYQTGPLINRPIAHDWHKSWMSVTNDYERTYNPDRWVALYHGGKVLFSEGDRHPLLDLIEKCDAENNDVYDNSIALAEAAFRKTGKNYKIEYDGNVALVVDLEEKGGRCGIILRGADKTRTFNFSVTAKKNKRIDYAQCMVVAAGFLEGIQLAFMVGMNEEKINLGHLAHKSDEARQTREARKRLGKLSAEITGLEDSCEVHYRPERPEFKRIIMDAEKMARSMFNAIKPGTGKDDEDDEDEIYID